MYLVPVCVVKDPILSVFAALPGSPIPQTTISTTLRFLSTHDLTSLPFECDFGDSFITWCDFTQDATDDFDWIENKDGTPTEHTGPPESGFQEHGM